MDRCGACVAPGCGAETPSRWHHLCRGCLDRCEAAMREARPGLIESMVTERREAEAWLAADWAPARRWVISDHEYRPEPLDTVVARMVEETASEWGAPSLGFVDDTQHAPRAAWAREHIPEREAKALLAWRVPGHGSETATAWRAHLAPLLAAALEQALGTFPLRWAGHEIKLALTLDGGYSAEQYSETAEELLEGTGPTGLSSGALQYLELRHDPHRGFICEADDWPESLGAELWERHRSLLHADIWAMLDAVRKASDAEKND